jgi:hypothetical protein
MYYAYELQAYLKHLIMTDENGKVEWIGKREDWERVKEDMEHYEYDY